MFDSNPVEKKIVNALLYTNFNTTNMKELFSLKEFKQFAYFVASQFAHFKDKFEKESHICALHAFKAIFIQL